MLSSYSVSHACVGLSLKHDYKLIQMKHVLQHNYISFLRFKVHCAYKQNSQYSRSMCPGYSYNHCTQCLFMKINVCFCSKELYSCSMTKKCVVCCCQMKLYPILSWSASSSFSSVSIACHHIVLSLFRITPVRHIPKGSTTLFRANSKLP